MNIINRKVHIYICKNVHTALIYIKKNEVSQCPFFIVFLCYDSEKYATGKNSWDMNHKTVSYYPTQILHALLPAPLSEECLRFGVLGIRLLSNPQQVQR